MATGFDPFRELDRLFNTAVARGDGGRVPMDLYRKGDTYVCRLDLPGVDPDSIDIDIEERVVTIRATRVPEQGEDIQWLSRERSYGTMARQVSVGDGLALDQASAEYDEGVLTLTFPVAEAAKPRKLAVKTQSGKQDVVVGETEESAEQA